MTKQEKLDALAAEYEFDKKMRENVARDALEFCRRANMLAYGEYEAKCKEIEAEYSTDNTTPQ